MYVCTYKYIRMYASVTEGTLMNNALMDGVH